MCYGGGGVPLRKRVTKSKGKEKGTLQGESCKKGKVNFVRNVRGLRGGDKKNRCTGG